MFKAIKERVTLWFYRHEARVTLFNVIRGIQRYAATAEDIESYIRAEIGVWAIYTRLKDCRTTEEIAYALYAVEMILQNLIEVTENANDAD